MLVNFHLLALALMGAPPLAGENDPFTPNALDLIPPPHHPPATAYRDLPNAEIHKLRRSGATERKPGARAAAVAKRQKRMARNLRNRPTPALRAA